MSAGRWTDDAGALHRVQVVPVRRDADKTAVLLHPQRTATANAVTGQKHHLGRVRAGGCVLLDRQPQPLGALAGRLVQLQLLRTGVRVPAGTHIVGIAQYIGAVARAHQGFGISGRLTLVQGLATGCVGTLTTARAKRGNRLVHAAIVGQRGSGIQQAQQAICHASGQQPLGYALAMTDSHPRRHRWKAAALLLAGLAITTVVLTRCRGPQLEVVRLAPMPLEQRVVASGRVSAVSRVQVGSEVAGVVLERRVNEGDRVEPGQILLVLRADDLAANLAEARASLATLEQSRRPQAQASLRQAQAQLAQAEREYQRRQTLDQQQLVARESVEQARQAVLSARANRDQAASAWQALAAGGAEAAQYSARVAAAQAALDKTQVRATQAGTVLTRAVEPGDTVQPGSVLLELASDGPTELRVPVDEKNLGVLAVGQHAQAVADAWPDRPFPATVSWIAPSVDSSRGSVEVRLEVDPVPDFLRQDLTVSVNILSARKDQALVVPNTALLGTANGGSQASVWQVRDGRLLRTPVSLGLRGTSASEVLGGLTAGDRVVIDARSTLQQDQRVRARDVPTAAGDLPAQAD